MANVGFCPSMHSAYWGSTDWAGLDHMSSFRAFVWACLCGNRISCDHCVSGFNGPYIHCGASVGPATETNWYIQAPAPFGSHDTSQMDKKKDILVCWKSWEKLGRHSDGAVKQPWAIKLQSDVNLGCPQAHGRKAPFTRRTQIKQFVCQFTCHLNGFLFVYPLFKWGELPTVIDL